MATCVKEYTLEVATGVLFSWGAAVESATPPGIAVFTPDLGFGNAAVGTATEPTGGIGVPNAQAFNFGLATINTSAVVPCNMHIKSIYTGPALGLDFGSSWLLAMYNNTLVTQFMLEFGSAQTGVNINVEYDVPFNLPNTGGVDNEIEFDLNVFCGENGGSGFATSLSVEATFSVL
jgi:hypothetical protein